MLKFEVRTKKSGETHRVISSSLLIHYGGKYSFGEFLKQVRKKKNLTIEDIAKLMDNNDIEKTMNTIKSIEEGYTKRSNYFGELVDLYKVTNKEIEEAVIKHNIAEDCEHEAKRNAESDKLDKLNWGSYYIKPMRAEANERLTQTMQKLLKKGYVILSVGKSIDDWFEASGLAALSDEEQEERGFNVSLLYKMWRKYSINQAQDPSPINSKLKLIYSVTWGLFNEQTDVESSYNTKYRIPALLAEQKADITDKETLLQEKEDQPTLVRAHLIFNDTEHNSSLTFNDIKEYAMKYSNEMGYGSVLVGHPNSDKVEIFKKSYDTAYSTHSFKEGSNPFAAYFTHLGENHNEIATTDSPITKTIGFGEFTHTYYGARTKSYMMQYYMKHREIFSYTWSTL